MPVCSVPDNADYVTVAKIGAPFGVEGWVKLISYTRPETNLFNYSQFFYQHNDRQWRSLRFLELKKHGKGFVAQIQGCCDRDKAATYTHQELSILRKQMPELTSDEYYWSDLEGLTVVTAQEVILGKVDHLIEVGTSDVMVIQSELSKKQWMIPFLKAYVLNVDLEKQLITVNWDLDL